jgi:anhydro-N-acetylmuramic acid kinase
VSELGIGLMSGTSLDGIDAALVEIGGERDATLRAFVVRPYAPEERDGILEAIATGSARDLALLHRRLGELFAEATAAVLREAGMDPGRLSFIASHGQTVWHEPGHVSLQLGCPATIAERIGVRVVSDFRARDVAAGGQGAPLVPIADVMLFGAERHPRILLNIGGMANVTRVPRQGATAGVLAFDTGPGVAVIDGVVRALLPDLAYDPGGRCARAGAPVAEVVERLLADPYFLASPPKSTGRERFGTEYTADLIGAVRERRPEASAEDCVATATLLTARTVADQVRRWIPDAASADVVVSGGGARNPVLLEWIARDTGGLAVRPFDDLFFDGDAKEAVAFAYLGWRTLHGLAGNVPAATGASGPRVLGSVTSP